VQIRHMQEKRDRNDDYKLRLYRTLKHEIKTITKEEYRWTGNDMEDEIVEQKRYMLQSKLWRLVQCVGDKTDTVPPHDCQSERRGWCKRCKFTV
jgi:hypothetical protein